MRGSAFTVNMQKKSVIRAEWKPVHVSQALGTPRARAAFESFMAHDEQYSPYAQQHARVFSAPQHHPQVPLDIEKSYLILFHFGMELAARPVLCAMPALAD